MKKFLKVTGIVTLIFIVCIIGLLTYIRLFLPKVSYSKNIKVESTQQRIERGKYLANGFAGCINCHSQRDFTKLYGPVVPGTEGKGGNDFGESFGFIPSANISSDKETGIGNRSDDELFRAITMGIGKNGEALAPMMPYREFSKMDEEDVYSIIAYIRTLPPISNKVAEKKINFPFSLIVRTMPSDPEFTKLPDAGNKTALGKYYSGACFACHTPMTKSGFDMEKMFSGGNEYPNPTGGIIRSANLTPDKETGIGNLSREDFIKKFKSLAAEDKHSIPVKNGEFNTVMPWLEFAKTNEEDLGAIYDYLMTLKPVKNKVEKIGIEGVN
jgi:hypothetical protein